MTDQMRYEVTVPIVVYVTTTGDDVEVTHAAISSDWGGFFTEAEEAGGVWDCSAEEWEYVENVYAAARNRVAWLQENGR